MARMNRTLRLLARAARPGPAPPRTITTGLALLAIFAVSIPLLVGAGVAFAGDPGDQFNEGMPGTALSVLFLGVAALLAMLLARDLAPLRVARFWFVLSLLLGVAMVDDMLKIHERLDHRICDLLGLDPTGPADRIDDAIVALYALPAGVAAYMARHYLLRLRWMVVLLAIASGFFAMMVLIDTLAHNQALEESIKLLAGGLVVAAFVAAREAPLNRRLLARSSTLPVHPAIARARDLPIPNLALPRAR